MGKSYGHVTIEERCEIARLQASGYSIRQIAASLDRSASTVARELKRNGSRTLGYQARYADQQAHARRWSGSRLERDRGLREQVLCRLKQAGLRSRWRVGWRWSQARGSSPMRASTASYTGRWLGRRTMGGDTTYLEPSRSGAGEAAKGAVLPPLWLCGALLPSVPRVLLTAALPGIGRRT